MATRIESVYTDRHCFGVDGLGANQAFHVEFPKPAGVGGRYTIYTVGSGHSDAQGSYINNLFQIGYNLERVVGEPTVSLNNEHRFRQVTDFVEQTETFFTFSTPSQTIHRRPYGFAGRYTGEIFHEMNGFVRWQNSAATNQRMFLEDGGNFWLVNGTSLNISRPNAQASGYLVNLLTEGGTVLARVDWDGSMALGGTNDGEGRLYLKGTANMARMFFVNQTDNKTFYAGSIAAYAGHYIIDQSGVGHFWRINHTSGRMFFKLPASAPAAADFLDINGFGSLHLDEAGTKVMATVRQLNGVIKTAELGSLV